MLRISEWNPFLLELEGNAFDHIKLTRDSACAFRIFDPPHDLFRTMAFRGDFVEDIVLLKEYRQLILECVGQLTLAN